MTSKKAPAVTTKPATVKTNTKVVVGEANKPWRPSRVKVGEANKPW